ncbi:unnamed protein product [Ambrosiozyma monospora]|uniref:Unnamed protein product n=1 Tax=Ambrosiozyma monospora TaxID=43982 RepID=A0ACB5T7T3_AMBMO|nr:unnamed protein product [Ambrosiozyma monospora]
MPLIRKLPQKFLGVLPLYTGVELIMLYGIINRMSGVYGLLSLFTGHPIDFIQWIFYLSSTLVLVFYVIGFKQVRQPSMNSFSLVVLVYLLDTIIGCLFTLYFVWFWFAEQSQQTTGDSTIPDGLTGTPLDKKPIDDKDEFLAGTSATATAVVPKHTHDDALTTKKTLGVNAAKAIGSATGQLVKRVAEDLESQSASESYELVLTIGLTISTTLLRFYFTLIVLSFYKQLVLASKYDSRFRISTSVTTGSKFAIFMNKLELKAYSILNKLV